jgi:RND family efflux transporter MFP subunit
MRLRVARCIAVSLTLSIALLASACDGAKAVDDKAAQAVLTVEAVLPEQRELPTVVDTAGVLAAWQEVSIGSEVTGYRINEVLVDVGAVVKKGQPLARLDDTLLRAELEQRNAALSEAQASLAEAQANVERIAALGKLGAISEQEAVQKKTVAATARARVVSAQAQLDVAQYRLNYATIAAPDDGVISARTVTPGQLAAGGGEFFKLIRQHRVEWRAEIPEAQISKVRAGMTVRVKRADGTFATGKIRAVAPSLDNNTRRGIAYADLKLENGLRPGMFVTGNVELGTQQTRTLPLSAVTVRDGFSYVFVIGNEQKIAQRRVQTGRIFNDSVEILDGIAVDERVVLQGAGFLRDGDLVRVSTGQLAKN